LPEGGHLSQAAGHANGVLAAEGNSASSSVCTKSAAASRPVLDNSGRTVSSSSRRTVFTDLRTLMSHTTIPLSLLSPALLAAAPMTGHRGAIPAISVLTASSLLASHVVSLPAMRACAKPPLHIRMAYGLVCMAVWVHVFHMNTTMQLLCGKRTTGDELFRWVIPVIQVVLFSMVTVLLCVARVQPWVAARVLLASCGGVGLIGNILKSILIPGGGHTPGNCPLRASVLTWSTVLGAGALISVKWRLTFEFILTSIPLSCIQAECAPALAEDEPSSQEIEDYDSHAAQSECPERDIEERPMPLFRRAASQAGSMQRGPMPAFWQPQDAISRAFGEPSGSTAEQDSSKNRPMPSGRTLPYGSTMRAKFLPSNSSLASTSDFIFDDHTTLAEARAALRSWRMNRWAWARVRLLILGLNDPGSPLVALHMDHVRLIAWFVVKDSLDWSRPAPSWTGFVWVAFSEWLAGGRCSTP